MKKLVAIIALFGILLQTFSQVVIIAEYYANKDFIANNLCENRNKPKMHCNGKCYLKKKMAKDGKEQAPTPRSQKNEDVVNLFCESVSYEVGSYFAANQPVKYHHYDELSTCSFIHSVFHPPAA